MRRTIIGPAVRLTPLARRLFRLPTVSLAATVAKGVSIVTVQSPVAVPARPHPISRRMSRKLSTIRKSHVTAHTPPQPRAARCTINPSKLEEVEDRLLAQAIEHHAQVEAALDGALDDMAVLSAELRRSRRRPLLLRSATNLNRVEDLLLEAIVRTHPNRADALDRLLADVSGDDAAADAEARERAAFDATVDNDFDGMA